ncbi:hypothetical protein RND81_07G118800 [Saponaria officinalis]|uniref:Uncharacterized protein n=1 Tax=Saponaria officinalis TaxID=3572 RepID=A0AAW1JQ59_SAPOF
MKTPSTSLTLSPSQRRRSITDSLNSPEFEFEFWNSDLQPLNTPLHSADQLFSHGFLLPLQSLTTPQTGIEPGSTSAEPTALITSDASSSGNSILSASKRWREIFKKKFNNDNNTNNNNNNNDNINCEEIKQEKIDKKREKGRKSRHGPGSAELNINIWPFSRSRSAGSNTTRSSKPTLSNRKVSSAPCSRSNSSGESKSSRRSWPSSPSRAGVHVGRASPVWQVRKVGPGGRALVSGEARRGKVLNLNVPLCVGGNRQRVSCRNDGCGAVVGGGGGNGNLFGLRGLFSKKSNTNAVLTV